MWFFRYHRAVKGLRQIEGSCLGLCGLVGKKVELKNDMEMTPSDISWQHTKRAGGSCQESASNVQQRASTTRTMGC